MPLFFQQDIDEDTRLAIWKIDESEDFFRESVSLSQAIAHPHKRTQHLAGRYLLRHLFPHFPLSLIQIADTRKPFLEDEAYNFSISHCGVYAAALVSKTKRVGIDIELSSEKVVRIKHKFLHSDELENLNVYLANKSGNDVFYTEQLILTLLWSCKEAVFKWWSKGQVDFSEMIRVQVPELQTKGVVSAQFISANKEHDLQIHYRLFDNLCLAWVINEV